MADPNTVLVKEWIQYVGDDRYRESAIDFLAKNKRICKDMAVMLWHSFNTIFTLLQELSVVYRFLSTPALTEQISNRGCSVLSLLQSVASHQDTRIPFMKANIHLYLYPFLETVDKGALHASLRLGSLWVIAALVKTDDAEVISSLVRSQLFPHCVRCIEVGNDMSKTVATFILQKLLVHEEGLGYCSTIAEQFYTVNRALGDMIKPGREPSQQLLKYIILCYHRLSDSPRACSGLRRFLPARLRDSATINRFRNDPTAGVLLKQLISKIESAHIYRGPPKADDLVKG